MKEKTLQSDGKGLVMGRQRNEIKIITYVSRHNSERDVRDDELQEKLERALRNIVTQKQYEPIEPWMF